MKTPAPYESGWCESGHHSRCAHFVRSETGGMAELWCGCDCHTDEKTHPLPDQILATLEQLEHAAGQLWHVDLPDLVDQAAIDRDGARFALERLRGVLDELKQAAALLLLEISRVRP